jgi:hypothetical protein
MRAVAALPPDAEITLDESIELVEKMIERVCGERALPAHFATHDPALKATKNYSRNRHAHVFLGLREYTEDGFARLKVRDLTARVRKNTEANGFGNCLPERISWPDLWWEIQDNFIEESALEVDVDPAAPVPMSHCSKQYWLIHGPDIRAKYCEENRKLIEGDAPELISKLLRGRATMRIAELKRIVQKFVPDHFDQDSRVSKILTDLALVTLAEPGSAKATHVTTRAVYGMLSEVETIIAKATLSAPDAGAWQGAYVAAMRGTGPAAVHAALRTKLDECEHVPPGVDPISRFVIVDENLSEIESLWKDDELPRSTVWRAIRELENEDFSTLGTIFILPHSQRIGDQALADIIVRAREARATVILGFDESEEIGLFHGRLAASIADRLTRKSYGASEQTTLQDVERLLRAGLIRHAVDRLSELNILKFGLDMSASDVDAIHARGDVLVTDDPRRLFRGLQLHETNAEVPLEAAFVACNGAYAAIRAGDRVVITATDYATRPPKIRAGNVGYVDEVVSRNSIRIRLLDDSHVVVHLKEGSKVRPAQTLLIREARRALNLRMTMEITMRTKAWAGLLLAVRAVHAEIDISPSVADNSAELVAAIEANFGCSLPAALKQCRDAHAESSVAFDGFIDSLFPVPSKEPTPAMRNLHLAEEVRDEILKSGLAREGLWLLYDAIRPGAPKRQETLEGIRPKIVPNSLLEWVVDVIAHDPKEVRQRDPLSVELPVEFEDVPGRGYEFWAIWNFIKELESMPLPGANWGFVNTDKLKKHAESWYRKPSLT